MRITTDREGERGVQWLASLPEIVTELVERWGCTLDGPVMYGGVGVVVPVLQRQRPAVMKVSFPHPGNVAEPDAFAIWGGRGAVLLYERADEHFAMLLERALARTLVEVRDKDEVVQIAGQLSHRLAVPAPSTTLPRLRDRAPVWESELRQDAADLADPLPLHVVHAALATVRELGSDQPNLMVHGDFHQRNILAGVREPWLAVDPKGYVGDPAYDGGTLLRTRAIALIEEDDLDKALLRSLDIFTEAAELDRERVRRWAQFHAVQNAFWGRRHGFHLARVGPGLDRRTHLADYLAQLLV